MFNEIYKNKKEIYKNKKEIMKKYSKFTIFCNKAFDFIMFKCFDPLFIIVMSFFIIALFRELVKNPSSFGLMLWVALVFCIGVLSSFIYFRIIKREK